MTIRADFDKNGNVRNNSHKNRMKNEEKKHDVVDNDSDRETSTSCYPGQFNKPNEMIITP